MTAAPQASAHPAAPLTRTLSGLVLTGLAAVAVAGLAAVLLQRPYLVELAVPFLVVLVAGLLLDRPASLRAASAVPHDRIVEGDDADVVIELGGDAAGRRVVAQLLEPVGVTWADDTPQVRDLPLPADEGVAVRWTAQRPPWGVHRWADAVLRLPGPLGLVTYSGKVEVGDALRVVPEQEALERLARAARTGVVAGSRLAPVKASGFEFAGVRDFVPGDRRRDVNWRATARAAALRVNEHHPERSTDVVLLLDAFPTAGLPAAVRATVSLASAYLDERDRVGLLRFGTLVEWLRPAMGARQLYRIVDALLETSTVRGHGWLSLPRLSGQTLPPDALVLAITPLAETGAVNLVGQLAATGSRVAVVEVSDASTATPGPTAAERLGYALWRLEREELRDRLRDRGVPVVPWDTEQPVAPVIEEVAAFQRYARHRTG